MTPNRFSPAFGAAALALLISAALLPTAIAQDSGFSLEIGPAIADNRAVKVDQAITVAGTAPAGTVGAAWIVALGVDGTEVDRQTVSSSALNRGPAGFGQDPHDYLQVDSQGRVSGRLTLSGCRFAPRSAACTLPHVRQALLVMRMADGRESSFNDSSRVRVDYTHPFIRHYELIAPTRIRAVFSEPVRHERGDLATDWQVADRRVLSVEGEQTNDCVGRYLPGEDKSAGPTGCTRTLAIDLPIDEDATPRVEYAMHSLVHGAPQQAHEDYASNVVFRIGEAFSNALNRIRPPLPRIEEVDGTPPDEHDRVIGDSREPSVAVSNLRAGHRVFFEIIRDDNTKFTTEPETASEATHTTTLPAIGPGGEFSIHAIVEDPHGNRSTDAELQAARADASPSKIRYCVGALCPLPSLPVPVVITPEDELYTPEESVAISGAVDPAAENVTVQLRERNTGLVLQSDTTDGDGGWGFDQSLQVDRRYQFTVAALHGDEAQTADVPDIIRDTVPPQVQVLRPAADPTQVIQGQLDPRPRFGEGDSVTVSWLAADLALGDLVNPDHGDFVDIELHFADGATRAVGEGLDHALGEIRDHPYEITGDDILPQPREGTFEVSVTDLAGNVGSAQSFPMVIDGTLLGYTPFFIQNDPNEGVIEARFPVAVAGTTTSADWRIDGTPPRSVTVEERDGRSVAVLVAAQSITDPNATPEVQFSPAPLNLDPLQGVDGREINRAPRLAIDAIPPGLSIVPPDPGPINIDSVTVRGTTDETSRPNTIRALRDGQVVGQTTASTSGSFTLTVPLAPDRLNSVVVRAVDPAGNRSPDRTFEVIEDSTPPVVQFIHPQPFSDITRQMLIRWQTIDENPDFVDIEYRVNQGPWQTIAAGIPDSGERHWRVPAGVQDDDLVALRITATDLARNRGAPAVAAGLQLGPTVLAGLLEQLCDDPEPAPFADRHRIPAVHRNAVDCLYWLDIARGSVRGGLRYFDPQNDISRGQFAAFLFRSYGVIEHELPPPRDPRFDDVHAGHTFDEDIHRLAAAEVIFGYDARRYGPADPIKRDQTASLLLRTYGDTTGAPTDPQSPGGYFADTDGSVHRDNIDAAFEAGLVLGTVEPQPGQPGRYEPALLTTRAQMATVIVRFLYLYAS